jgi:hypothetical protein
MLTLKLHNFVERLFATQYYTCEIHQPPFQSENIHTSMKGFKCGKQNCVIVHIPCENEFFNWLMQKGLVLHHAS